MEHTCIKPGCGNRYSSQDEDAYYCPDCVEARNSIAQSVDAKFAARAKKDIVSTMKQIEREGGVILAPGVKATIKEVHYGKQENIQDFRR